MALLDFGGITLRRHMFSGDAFLLGEATHWGENVSGSGVSLAEFSPRGYSLGSLGIGPDSDIDRVQLHYGLPAIKSGSGFSSAYNQLIQSVIVSNKIPFLSSIRGGKPGTITNRSLPFLIPVDIYDEEYYKEGTAGLSDFGDAMDAGAFYHPTLQVVVSGDGPLPATWGRRNPLVRDPFQNGQWIAALGNDNEGPYLVIPIHGRMRFAVTCRPLGAGAFDVRLAVVSQQIESQVAPTTGFPTKTSIPANGQHRFDVELDGRAEWLIVYVTRTAGDTSGDSLLVEVRGDDT
jgi:hypothetical protein